MQLFLIRHADAVPLGEMGITDDAERPLTERGRSQVRLLAGTFRRRGIRFDRILTSPLVRARQTCEGLIGDEKEHTPICECEQLAPGGKPRKLSKHVGELDGETFALVGHQPDLGTYAAWLIGSKNAQIDLGKCGVAGIALADEPGKGQGTLFCLLSPEWLGDAK